MMHKSRKIEFQTNSTKFLFSYKADLEGLRPVIINLEIEPKYQLNKWAILQVYRELTVNRDPKLRIDGSCPPGINPSCTNANTRPTTEPPFYSNFSTGWYSDSPTYDCPSKGKIEFYTVLAEINFPQNKIDFFSCKYSFTMGLKWGIKMNRSGTIESMKIRKMRPRELFRIATLYQNSYPKAVFMSTFRLKYLTELCSKGV